MKPEPELTFKKLAPAPAQAPLKKPGSGAPTPSSGSKALLIIYLNATAFFRIFTPICEFCLPHSLFVLLLTVKNGRGCSSQFLPEDPWHSLPSPSDKCSWHLSFLRILQKIEHKFHKTLPNGIFGKVYILLNRR